MYELYKSECDMVEDMNMIDKTYRAPLLTLNLISEDESEKIFGHLCALKPIHAGIKMSKMMFLFVASSKLRIVLLVLFRNIIFAYMVLY